MKVELPLGDVIDKISILRIKSERISAPEKLVNIHRELKVLLAAWDDTSYPSIEDLSEWNGLLEVNGKLWTVEDDLRILEAKQDFTAEFVRLARSVYFLNDQRATLKKSINITLESDLVEEKSYQDYGSGEGSSPLK
jgi:hypothetical protein